MAVELATARRMRRRSTAGVVESKSGGGERVLESIPHYTVRRMEVFDSSCLNAYFRVFSGAQGQRLLFRAHELLSF